MVKSWNEGKEVGVGLKVAVGMSGGVDSSVAALLLKRAGHDVLGVFIRSWEDDGECPAGEDAVAAAAAADAVGVDLEFVDFTKEYRDRVFSSFLDELRAGNTPNPDVWCNAVVKFGAFAEHALDTLGVDRFATGHYARIGSGGQALLKSEDEAKDQTYFLYRVTKDTLSKAIFPVGSLPKREVRDIAGEAGLPNHDRPESMGICFVGKRRLKDFLEPYIPSVPGPIVDDQGAVIGEHAGAHLYTIGQRQGLGLGGPGEPWYVSAKDVSRNEVVAVRGRGHPALLSSGVLLRDCSWVAGSPPKDGWVYTCRLRHGMEPAPCTLKKSGDSRATVGFAAPQWGVAPGQAAVLYDGLLCLGGGAIDRSRLA